MPYPATPKTWVAGDILTAAQLNAELRDALLGAFPLGPPDLAWTAYTPTLTQSATVTKTVTYAKYTKTGRKVTVNVRLAVTGAGTASNAILIGLPVPAATASFVPCGIGWVLDSSAARNYTGVAVLSSTTAVSIIANNDPAELGAAGGLNMTAALASPDTVNMSVTYEAAS